MSSITDLLAAILAAKKGEEVRGSIHDAIEQCYEDGRAGVNDLQARQLIEAVAAVNEEQAAALEVLQARVEELESGEGGSSQQSTTIDIPTVLVDGGVVENVSVNNNSTTTRHITFTTEFTETPKVMVAIGKNVGAVSQYGYLSANILYPTVTTTGFDFFLANRTGSDRSPGVVWYAYQPTVKTIDLDITIPETEGMTEAEVREITGPIAAAVDALKTGYDGTTYQTAAEAVRTQINDLHVLIGDEPGTAISADSIGYGDGSVADALTGLNGRLDGLKNDLTTVTDNTVISYNYPNSFFYTQEATWNPNAPSANTDYDAAVVDCSPGDIFTVSGIGGANPKIWAFADSSNNILARKENSITAITNEVITAPASAVKLILNNKKAVYPDAASYKGKLIKNIVNENSENLRTKLGNVKTVTETTVASTGRYFNLYFDVSPVDGDVALVRVNSYSGTKLSKIIIIKWKSNSEYTVQISDAKIGRTYPVLLDSTDKKVWVQLMRSEVETATAEIVFACNDEGGTGELIVKNFNPVFYVEKDGSGDFNKLVDAVRYATQFFDSTVYVGAGTWNVINEFGETYMQSCNSNQRGLYLKNRIHLIFSSNAVVTAMYDGFNGSISDDTVEWFSIFNSGEYGFTIENLTSISRNIRYPIHDERSQTTEEAYKNHYINCNITHSNQKYDNAQTKHGYAQCIGGGLGKDGHIIIEGCVFENTYQYSADAQGRKNLVTYHVNNKPNTTGRSTVEIKGCYFKGEGTARAGYYGTNTDVSTMLVHDNSMGKEPYVAAESAQSTTENIQMLAWNNEIRTT